MINETELFEPFWEQHKCIVLPLKTAAKVNLHLLVGRPEKCDSAKLLLFISIWVAVLTFGYKEYSLTWLPIWFQIDFRF